MANTLVQFRTDETSRIKAMLICEQLGIDLQTYMRMCISRLISENGIPFSMKVQDSSGNKGILALREMGDLRPSPEGFFRKRKQSARDIGRGVRRNERREGL